MLNSHFWKRQGTRLGAALTLALVALCCLTASAQTPVPSGSPIPGLMPSPSPTPVVARQGTPSMLYAVDTTMRIWSDQFQKLGPYACAALILFAAYVTAKLVFEIIFASGTFGPRAASVGAWVGSLVALIGIVLMLPATWPWWTPYAVSLTGFLIILVMITSLSRKAV